MEEAGYTHGPGIDDPLIARYNNANYYCHKNHQGSVTEITSGNQSIVKTYEYDAYGNILQETGPSLTGGFTYTARELHTRSGLYYYRARFYSPEVGRFLTQDPAYYISGPNLYAYVLNDPLNFIDPLGLDWLDVAANYSAGFGDFITGGLTNQIREGLDINEGVEKCSKSYKAGEWTGLAWDVAFIGAFAWEAAPVAARAADQIVLLAARVPYGFELTVGTMTRLVPTYVVKLHGAHHTFPYLGKVRHIQVVEYYKGVTGSGVTLDRIPLPWWW